MTPQLLTIYLMWQIPAGLVLVYSLYRIHVWAMRVSYRKLQREALELDSALQNTRVEREYWKQPND